MWRLSDEKLPEVLKPKAAGSTHRGESQVVTGFGHTTPRASRKAAWRNFRRFNTESEKRGQSTFKEREGFFIFWGFLDRQLLHPLHPLPFSPPSASAKQSGVRKTSHSGVKPAYQMSSHRLGSKRSDVDQISWRVVASGPFSTDFPAPLAHSARQPAMPHNHLRLSLLHPPTRNNNDLNCPPRPITTTFLFRALAHSYVPSGIKFKVAILQSRQMRKDCQSFTACQARLLTTDSR